MFGFPYAVRMRMTKHDWRELMLLVGGAAILGFALSFLMPVWVSIPACLICGVVLGQATAMRQVHRDHEELRVCDLCSCGCGCEPDGDWHWSQRPWCPCVLQSCPCVIDNPGRPVYA